VIKTALEENQNGAWILKTSLLINWHWYPF